MTLHELVAWVVDVWPPINYTVSTEFLLKLLDDGGNMLVASDQYHETDLPDRVIDHPKWVIMVKDNTQMPWIDISWGDSIDDWIMYSIIAAIHRGYEHLYFFSCDPDHPKYRDHIYINIEKVKESDWARLENTLKEWSESRDWPTDWKGTREEWLQGKVKTAEMNRCQLESRYQAFGLADFVLKSVYDILNVHHIDYSSVQGYFGLVHLFRVNYKTFLVRFFNAFDLDNRAILKPLGIYWVESQDKVAVTDDGSLVWAGGTVVSVDKFKNRVVLDDWFDEEYTRCEIIVEEPTQYLRFEYMHGDRKEWLHIIKNGEEWY